MLWSLEASSEGTQKTSIYEYIECHEERQDPVTHPRAGRILDDAFCLIVDIPSDNDLKYWCRPLTINKKIAGEVTHNRRAAITIVRVVTYNMSLSGPPSPTYWLTLVSKSE